MPASRSRSRDAKPAPRSRSYWPLVLIGLAAALAVIIVALPASIITRFLPPVHRKSLKIMSRAMRFAVGAAGLALEDSGLVREREDPERLGHEPDACGDVRRKHQDVA